MNDANLIWNLPGRLSRIVQENLTPGEQVIVKLKGVFNEALVCTERRVMVIKSGFMTGNTFGSDIFQVPYANITGAQVNAHLLTGYFEVSAGGIQNQPKSYWQTDKNSPEKSPNCVSLNRGLFTPFRAASNLIIERVYRAHAPQNASDNPPTGTVLLEHLAKLRDAGILSDAEFEAKKTEILSRLLGAPLHEEMSMPEDVFRVRRTTIKSISETIVSLRLKLAGKSGDRPSLVQLTSTQPEVKRPFIGTLD